MKVSLFGKQYNKDFSSYMSKIIKKLKAYEVEIYIYEPFNDFLKKHDSQVADSGKVFSSYLDMPTDTSFVISIGGDGTFLESLMLVRNTQIPVVGINSGRLGFLANIAAEDISDSIDAIMNDRFSYEKRSMIEIFSPKQVFDDFNFGLNEVTIQKKDSSLITIHCYLDDELLSTYWTDGLIVSTPTGSTAYSLSVGGPIMVPGNKDFIISPIASHNLSVRPVIIPDSMNITLKVDCREDEYLLTIDNRRKHIEKNTVIKLKKASFCVMMVKLQANNFYQTLRSKLMWGQDKRN